MTSQIAASSLTQHGLPLGIRQPAEKLERELGYLRYNQSFFVRPRPSSLGAFESKEIGLQMAVFEAYTVQSMQAWC